MPVTFFPLAIWDEHKSAHKYGWEIGNPLPCNSKEMVLNFFGSCSHLSWSDCSKVENMETKQTDSSLPSGAINQLKRCWLNPVASSLHFAPIFFISGCGRKACSPAWSTCAKADLLQDLVTPLSF